MGMPHSLCSLQMQVLSTARTTQTVDQLATLQTGKSW